MRGFDTLGDVPVGLGRALRGEAEDCFERNMPVKAPIVAKDEFVEIDVDMFAAQAMIRAQRPTLHQREGSMAPWQDDMRRHLADEARIVAIIA